LTTASPVKEHRLRDTSGGGVPSALHWHGR
jgi:hypothetical protein